MENGRLRKRQMTNYLNEATECELCGSRRNLELHHIIPISLQSLIDTDIDTKENWIVVCHRCHASLTPKGLLVRIGLEKAQKNGTKLGRKNGYRFTTKKGERAKEVIKTRNVDFGGDLSNEETIELAGVARNTFFRYKRELKEVSSE